MFLCYVNNVLYLPPDLINFKTIVLIQVEINAKRKHSVRSTEKHFFLKMWKQTFHRRSYKSNIE